MLTTSLWKRRVDTFDGALCSLGDALTLAVSDIFAKYDQHVKDQASARVSASQQGSHAQSMELGPVDERYDSETDLRYDDDDPMSSEDSWDEELPSNLPRFTPVEGSDSDDCMSITNKNLNDRHHKEDVDTLGSHQAQQSWRVAKRTTEDFLLARERRPAEARLGPPNSSKHRCLRCEAYDAHCKVAAETYRRVLANYTKTVSELMIGFKKVLEMYPELRVHSSDGHLHCMVQAALGRNNLVQEMVRLAAKRQTQKAFRTEPGEEEAKFDHVIVSVHEALNTCYTDGEALRMILERYTNLYVRYIEVWREMCSKVSRDITVMEFMNLTQDRPGVSHGEPWAEAKAYIARMLAKVGTITPRAVGEACARALKKVDVNLSLAPKAFDKHKGVIHAELEDMRGCLDRSSHKLSWDSHMTDLYFDIRSDLAVLEALTEVGEISVKTLLHERSMLVSQVRKLTRNQGSLELQVAQTRSKLRDSVARCRHAEMNALQ